ncbi:MAG TPA: FAD:protein FMN transferase [Vicinamibacteria bacterium]|jgi:thiamine biosynthesis lipoprotein|nr:FAD:protein FMN transferase [Vicinamibacteria bacterium]
MTTSRPLGPLTRRELFTLPRRQGGEEAGHWVRVHRQAMACRFEIMLAEEDAAHVAAARQALDEADRIEDALSVFRESSEVMRVNREGAVGPVAVSQTLFTLLRRCQGLHADVEGAFDPTSTPLSRTWGFLARAGRLPGAEDIAAALSLVGLDKVELNPEERTVRFPLSGMSLNFGGIGKGYALDRMVERLRARGVPRALLSAGGSSVLAFGGGPGFRVNVRSPLTTAVIARLRIQEAALGTSGAGEQYFETGGRRYGHVLDPRTGWPVSGVLSASAAAPSAADADALSTAFLVGGPGLAERYCAAHPGTLAVLVLEAEPARPLLFGGCEGLRLEEP